MYRLKCWQWAACLTAIALLGMTTSWAEEGYVGSEACATCHEDVAAAFGRTAHAVAPEWDAEKSCESCHGPGAEHADGDVDAIRKASEMTPTESSDTCLTCHNRQEKHFSAGQAIHRLGEVSCADCHNPHSTSENLLREEPRQLCASCHQAVAAQFDMPRAHPNEECTSCHQPHSSRAVRTDSTVYRETCTQCHFEKSGPFLYDHDVMMVDGCASCHEVHGSSNRHLLKHEPQVNLCYQCHSASVTPSFHNTRNFVREKCTACHTAIHGSNTNPQFLEE